MGSEQSNSVARSKGTHAVWHLCPIFLIFIHHCGRVCQLSFLTLLFLGSLMAQCHLLLYKYSYCGGAQLHLALLLYSWKWLPTEYEWQTDSQPWITYVCVCKVLLVPFDGFFSRTSWVSRHQKGRTILDFNEARDDGWQWHQLDHMQIMCTSLQTDNHAALHHSFFTGRMLFLLPNQKCQSTEGKVALYYLSTLCMWWWPSVAIAGRLMWSWLLLFSVISRHPGDSQRTTYVFAQYLYLGPEFLDSGSQSSLNISPQNLHTSLVCSQALKPTFQKFSLLP